MKLYTEEEVKQMLDFFQVRDEDIVQFIDKMKPIELPSDEEIIEEAYKQGAMIFSFTNGSKWMRDKIQGGNNEQKVISQTASTNTAQGYWVKDLKIQGGNNE